MECRNRFNMKTKFSGLASIVLSSTFACSLSASASALENRNVLHSVEGAKALDLYDAKKMVVVAGNVTGMQTYRPAGSSYVLLDIIVQPKKGKPVLVELGPAKYVAQQHLDIKMNEKIRVYGSQVAREGDSFVLVQKMLHQGERIAFRKEDGTPFFYSSAYAEKPPKKEEPSWYPAPEPPAKPDNNDPNAPRPSLIA